MCVIWLISEFCNRGPLLTAVERGVFLTQPSSQYGQPNLIAVLQAGLGVVHTARSCGAVVKCGCLLPDTGIEGAAAVL